MATIVFFFSHCSHQNSSLKLARMLQKAGHNIIYAGTEFGISGDQLKKNVQCQGFAYIEINFFSPAGKKTHRDINLASHEKFQHLMFNLFDGNIFKNFISSCQPDLLVLDNHIPHLAIIFYKFGIPTIFSSATILTDKSEFIPPLNSPIIPTLKKIKTGEVKKSWEDYMAIYKMKDSLKKSYISLGKRHDFPFEQFLLEEKSIVPFGFKFSEIIFWPEALDFPRPVHELEDKYYLGGLVDIKRKRQQDFQLPQTDKPIIYCMLGTRSKHANDKKNQFLRALIHKCAEIEQYFFVFSLGRYLKPSDFPDLPDHILLASFIPQIEVLQKATIMINHAGGDSIKECIRFAVPMICFPFSDDQFGNGARIAYHQLGIVKPFQQEELKNIDQMLEELLQNEIYGQNVQKFQQLFIENEQSDYAVKVIESFLEK